MLLNSPMTTNIQLERAMDKIDINGRAVLSKDQLYAIPPLPGSYIINLDSSTGPGTHWVALWLGPKVALYFDSFGAPPPMDIIKFIRRYRLKRFTYSEKQIQNIRSGYCGQYSLAFLHKMSLKPKHRKWDAWYNEFLNEFANA